MSHKNLFLVPEVTTLEPRAREQDSHPSFSYSLGSPTPDYI